MKSKLFKRKTANGQRKTILSPEGHSSCRPEPPRCARGRLCGVEASTQCGQMPRQARHDAQRPTENGQRPTENGQRNTVLSPEGRVMPTGAKRSGGISLFRRFLATLGMTALLLSLFPALLSAQSNGVDVSELKVEAGTVTFSVSWNKNKPNMPALWLDSAWVFVDYNDAGVMRRLPVAGAALTNPSWSDATVIQYPGNEQGVWVVGNAKQADNSSGSFSATVKLFSPIASTGLAGMCAYASNYPPVGEYIDANTIKFTGTPMFKIVLEPVPCAPVYDLKASATTFCAGSPVTFALSNTTSGKTYRLYKDNTPVGVINAAGGAATFTGAFAGAGVYTAQVDVERSDCPATMNGAHHITETPLPAIAYLSGSASQSVTQGVAITDIKYTTAYATGATYSGLPAGVGGTWSANTYTIAGAPTASGTFGYTVRPTHTNGCAASTSAAGTLVVSAYPPGAGTATLTVGNLVWSGKVAHAPSDCAVVAKPTSNDADQYSNSGAKYYYTRACAIHSKELCVTPWRTPNATEAKAAYSASSSWFSGATSWDGDASDCNGFVVRDCSPNTVWCNTLCGTANAPYGATLYCVRDK